MPEADVTLRVAFWLLDSGRLLAGIRLKTFVSTAEHTKTSPGGSRFAGLLRHNLVILIHEMHERGIDPMFWSKSESPGIVC